MAIRDLLPWNWGHKKEEHDDDARGMTTPRTDMNRLFEDFFRGFDRNGSLSRQPGGSLFDDRNMPKLDVSETDDEIEVVAELPGMSEDDIDVSITHDVLRIRGQKKEEREEKKKHYHLTERSWGSFYREVTLWTEVAADNIDARFKKGVLTLKLPKTGDSSKSKRISVRAA